MTDHRFSRLGAEFEATVEASLEQMPQDRCMWFRDSPPFQVQRWQGRLALGYFKSGGNLDFYGAWRGRFMAFDAKSTQEDNRFPVNEDVLKPEQVEIVRQAARLGLCCFFLVALDSGNLLAPRVFCLTWDVLGPIWERREAGEKGRGVGSIPLAVLEAQCVEVARNGSGYLDLAPAFDALTG